jgi:hypothetical protein
MIYPVFKNKYDDTFMFNVSMTIIGLSKYCSEYYAKQILKAFDDKKLLGLYLTNSGRIKAEIKP